MKSGREYCVVWCGYEHHESTGKIKLEEYGMYLQQRQYHHRIVVIDDSQQRLTGLAEERRRYEAGRSD